MPRSIQQFASRLTFRQLQVFLAVYDQQGFSKAGELLGLTQPAVSSQVKQLEDALGQPLFEYVGRRLYNTPMADELAHCVETIFNELRQLQTRLADNAGQVAGELYIAGVNTAQYVTPYILKGFLAQYPKVKVTVRVVNRAEAIQSLQDNNDDLIIMGMVPDNKPLASLPFLDNELIPIVPANHPLLKQQKVSPQEFFNSDLLIRESGSGSRLALELHIQQQRLQLKPFMRLGSNDAVKHAVLAGLGVAVLPRLSVLSELKLGTLATLDLEGFPLRRSWCVVYPKGKHPTPAMKAFIEYVQENIKYFNKDYFESSILGETISK